MKSSRVLTGALVVGSVAIASMFAAAPAVAATLPAGQKITVIDQDSDQYFNVNPANAESAPVGTPTPVVPDVTGVDVDDAGLGYAIATLMDTVPPEGEFPGFSYPSQGWLYKADANTGSLTDGKQILIDIAGEIDLVANSCQAIDYSKGVITAVCNTYAEILGAGTAHIGTIDPATAKLTPLTTISGPNFISFDSIAIHPTNGTIYGFGYGSGSGVWTITLDNVQPVLVKYIPNYLALGADFDRDGQLWLSVTPFSIASILANVSFLELATFDFAAQNYAFVENFSSADPVDISEPQALTVWGVLAATGSSVSPAPAIVASGILLLGALLAAGTMALRRRSADV